MARLSLALLLLVLAASCATSPGAPRGAGTTPPAGPRTEFPTAEEVEALARAPGSSRLVREGQREVEAWTLVQPPALAPADTLRTAAGPWDVLLTAVAAERQGLVWVSEPMACLARQAGQLYLASALAPDPRALGFMASRCGVGEPELGSGWVVQALSGGETDAELLERLRPMAQDGLRQALATGSQAAGVWYGRDRTRAVVFFVVAPRRARFEAFPEAPGPDGRVAVRGELLVPADRLHALVTHGRHGFRYCAPDPAVRLPRFAFACEVNRDDESARLELAAFPAGRLTGPVVASVWLWPRGVRSARYVGPPAAGGTRAPAGADLGATLVRELNRIRAEAGLSPVRLEAAQSDTAARLAPHYFAASAGLEPEAELDPIVLGLRAGWRVQGTVAAGFFTAALARERDVGRLLAAALERPSGREALLDPQVSAVAVGAVEAPSTGVTGAVFATYRLVDPGGAEREADEAIRRVNAARQARGLGPVSVLVDLRPAAAAAMRSVEQGARTPEAAMHGLAGQAANTVRGTALAWFLSADRLERVELPDKLLDTPGLRVVVAVGHYRPPRAPWAVTGVLVVAVVPEGTVTALAGR